ncbi:hypothetical protein VTJ83DRAFT_15 [Remersonia thermophila]|uniref:Hemerythrin-like domain-containing protein n=1 Tax=Remersonia thermophila TaxID=72144 RepID=A0ABR4DM87_9PEZI
MTRIKAAVKQDHALIKDLYHRLRDADPESRDPDEFVWALGRYLIVEDLVLTPALENHIANGGARHRRLSNDFDSITTKLRHMRRFDPSEPSFDAALTAIWVDLEPHVREEATMDLDDLEQHLSHEESTALGKKYEDIKELLQHPYGKNGVPDGDTLSAILDLSRQELMIKIGLF